MSAAIWPQARREAKVRRQGAARQAAGRAPGSAGQRTPVCLVGSLTLDQREGQSPGSRGGCPFGVLPKDSLPRPKE